MRSSSANLIADTQPPTVRYLIKARIFETGHRTFTEFAESIEVHRVYLSKILNGHEWPSPSMQRKMARQLGLTIKELLELL